MNQKIFFCNRGGLSIEAAVVMSVYMLVIFMSFQAFFLLYANVDTYCNEADFDISIEKTVENIRRWQFAGGGI